MHPVTLPTAPCHCGVWREAGAPALGSEDLGPKPSFSLPGCMILASHLTSLSLRVLLNNGEKNAHFKGLSWGSEVLAQMLTTHSCYYDTYFVDKETEVQNTPARQCVPERWKGSR